MITTELDQKTMETMQTLAATNIEISKAKGILVSLQEQKEQYIAKREQETIEHLERILADSEATIARIEKNNAQVVHFYATIRSFVEFMEQAHREIVTAAETIETANKEFDEHVARQHEHLTSVQKAIDERVASLESSEQDIERKNVELEKTMARIASRQAQLKTALQVLEKKKHEQ